MNNLTSARSTFKDQLAIVGRKHTWIMSYIYIGTFGSFIGYSAAFPLLIKTQFPSVTVAIAFLGPLVGSLSRPLGGWLADKVGGAIVTFWNFIAMGAATIGVIYFVDIKDFDRLPGDVPDPVRHDRDRQRLDLSDDPVDLPRGEAPGGERLGRCRPPGCHQGRQHRERRRARLHRRDRRLRRLPDPARLRRIDRRHRRSASGARHLPRVLRDLPGADLVVLPAQELPCGRAPRISPRRVCEASAQADRRNPHGGAPPPCALREKATRNSYGGHR